VRNSTTTTIIIISYSLSLTESTYLGRQYQLAKIIHQQTAIKYKLLDRNAPPYCRYKPEPVLESANMILIWDRSITTDKTVDFNRPDGVLIDTENKTTLVIQQFP
jgi:hypothetical protein